jgi:hypothetical protein
MARPGFGMTICVDGHMLSHFEAEDLEMSRATIEELLEMSKHV